MDALPLARRALDEFQKFPQVLFFRKLGLREFYAHSEGRRAACHHATQDYAFDPDLTARDPQADTDILPWRDWSSGFYKNSPASDIGEIAPDRAFGAFDAQFDRDETFDTSKTAPVLTGLRREQVGREGRRFFDRLRMSEHRRL